jgi:LmbE family N-acetylglucosaminyl deacetylase
MNLKQKCMLAVYAHPDDESFSVAGTFRKYYDEGVRTALICATRGEKGKICSPALATPETLGAVREQELREACRIIGVEDLTILGYQDGELTKVDELETIGRIVFHIRRLRPDLIITFDTNGDYGHPDHMAIHRFTVSAFHQAGDPHCYSEQLQDGLQPHQPKKLFAHAMAWSVMRKVYRQARAGGASFSPGGDTATIPVNQMGTPDEEITIVISLDRWQLAAKMAAMQAHRTQLDPDGPFYQFPTGAVREWLEIEQFKLLYPKIVQMKEDDLFTNVI